MPVRVRPFALTALLVAGTAATLPAQFRPEERYDLGLRLRRFERAWAATAPGAPARDVARQCAQRSVTAFFAMNARGAGAALDEGWLALTRDGTEADARRAAVAPLGARVARRIVAPGEAIDVAILGLDAIERTADPAQPHAELVAEFAGVTRVATGEELALAATAPGDYALQVGLRTGPEPGGTRWAPPVSVSVVADADAHVAALERELADADARLGDGARSLEAESLRGLTRLLGALARGQAHETDVPAARLFAAADALGTALREGDRYPTDAHPGEHWLRVPTGNRALAVRLLVPPRAADDRAPRPLIVALHGMGGSEHLFFDGYGDGLLIRLAAARGAYVVAPRAMPAGAAEALVEALAERFAIDRGRVYAVGHSMGAATAVGAASRFPALFAKVALLGGGGSPTDPAALRAVPFLIAPGEHDFARRGAEQLARALDAAGVPVTLRVVPGVEHLLVVEEALPATVAWLFGDAGAEPPRRRDR
ncbi:MAG: dienelactone hydrolase family protein [Planctomycetes bacterium]|nr:dienelactone hydrolase family protein [Planctomycetota bacterium]